VTQDSSPGESPGVLPERGGPSGTGLPPRSEFVVVGGGITGLSAAWALCRRGREVLVLDQARAGDLGGGSHGACRIFRLGYDDPAYVALARQARPTWAELEEAGGERLLHPTPQVTFGPQMREVHAAMIAAGAPCELVAAAEATARFPAVAVTGEVLAELESAVIAADRALACLGRLIRRAGTARTGVRVHGLADDGRAVMVRTCDGDIQADRVIVCAGPWTSRLLATARIAVPGSATLEQVAYLEPAAGTSGTTVAGDDATREIPIFVHYGAIFPYGVPVPGSRRYKIGIHHSGTPVDPDEQDQSPDADLSRRIEHAARRFLPGFDPRPVAQERCVYDNTPDTEFVVDLSGNVVIGSGTSGHGFKFGPLLGEWLADLATKGASPAIPARFALARF
jgi:sarcosine oxidase